MEIIITVSTVVFHMLSLSLLFLMVSSMMKEDESRIKKGGGAQHGDTEKPSQRAD